MYVYIYIYICVYICIHIYIYKILVSSTHSKGDKVTFRQQKVHEETIVSGTDLNAEGQSCYVSHVAMCC